MPLEVVRMAELQQDPLWLTPSRAQNRRANVQLLQQWQKLSALRTLPQMMVQAEKRRTLVQGQHNRLPFQKQAWGIAVWLMMR